MTDRKTAANKDPKITILRHCLKFLQFHCIWPKTDEELSPGNGLGFSIKTFAYISPYLFLMMTSVAHIVYVKTNKLDVTLYEDVVVIMAIFMFCVVTVEMYYKQKQFAGLLLKLCDYKFGRPKDLDRIESLLRFFSNGFYSCIILSIFLFGLFPIIEKSKCEKYFKMKGTLELCGYFIPTPPSFVPKIGSITIRPVVFGLQMCSALAAACPAGMLSILGFELNIHLVFHMKHLKSQIKSLSGDVTREELCNVAKFHQHIISTMDLTNKCSSRALGIHTIFTSSILASILHQLMNLTWETPAAVVSHLILWIVSLFLNSLGGELIQNESTDIGTALYFSDWLEWDQSLKKDMLLILIRTQKPLVLKGGPFGYLSLGVFISVLKGLHTLTITLMNI